MVELPITRMSLSRGRARLSGSQPWSRRFPSERDIKRPGGALFVGDVRSLWDVDPAVLRELAEELDYLVEISLSPPPPPMAEGDVDVLLSRPGTLAAPARLLALVAGAGARPHRAWSSYANNPRHAAVRGNLHPGLRSCTAWRTLAN